MNSTVSYATRNQEQKMKFVISEVKFLLSIINTNLIINNKKEYQLDRYLNNIFNIAQSLGPKKRLLYDFYCQYMDILHWWYHNLRNIWNSTN